MSASPLSRRAVLFGLAAASFPAPMRAQGLAEGEIVDTATGKALGFQDLIDRLEQADTILIGERHGFAPHQDRVALILEELALRGRFPTLALEMLEPAQMAALEAYRKENPEYVGALGVALDWANSGWPAWHFYEPIFRTAFRAKLEIVAADLPREKQREIDRFGREEMTADPELLEYWQPIVRGIQCNEIGDTWIRNVTVRQVLRDQYMADVINSTPSASITVVGHRHLVPLSKLLGTTVTIGLGTLEGSAPTYVWDLGPAEVHSAC